MSGVQFGSAGVSGLPSVSAARIAVTGRQKLYVYLASQQAILVSAAARFNRAKRRALSTRLVPWAAATCWATPFHWARVPVFGVTTPCQNMAASVWSAVR